MRSDAASIRCPRLSRRRLFEILGRLISDSLLLAAGAFLMLLAGLLVLLAEISADEQDKDV